MSRTPEPISQTQPPAGNSAAPDSRYRCGTLVYTKAGLFTLFAYLLWGDFCFSMMEAVWPKILPLVLKGEGTPNLVIALVITTIPNVMNFFMNPIVGTTSDRYRSRRGRRIPFLLFATPFVALFLLLLGFSGDLGRILHGALEGLFPALSPTGVTITFICGLIIAFRFFELIINTIFWYLFNDVVPAAFIGRFLGFFRVVGTLAGALFNFFLFKYATTHTSVIFFGVAALYGVGFFLMCLKVKEGQYPPPDRIKEKHQSPWVYVKTFFKECFSHRLFSLIYVYSMFSGMAGSIVAFTIFFEQSIGLTLDQIGKVSGVALFVGMLLMYPMGSLVDRFHPLRVMIVGKFTFCVAVSVNFVFLFYSFPNETAFWIYVGAAGIAIPVDVANRSAALPMLMRLFPHERFGQFCAANAMCSSLGMILGGALSGLYLDGLKAVFREDGEYYYRFVPLWSFLFIGLAFGTVLLVFREWKKLGGDNAYRPPIEDKFQDFHASPSVSNSAG
jgi:maltose/moltooligosaccharide transporter